MASVHRRLGVWWFLRHPLPLLCDVTPRKRAGAPLFGSQGCLVGVYPGGIRFT